MHFIITLCQYTKAYYAGAEIGAGIQIPGVGNQRTVPAILKTGFYSMLKKLYNSCILKRGIYGYI